jgi:hypothetical protein
MKMMTEWPAGATEDEKMRIWNRMLGLNLNRSWSVVKNEIIQRMRVAFLTSKSTLNAITLAQYY